MSNVRPLRWSLCSQRLINAHFNSRGGIRFGKSFLPVRIVRGGWLAARSLKTA